MHQTQVITTLLLNICNRYCTSVFAYLSQVQVPWHHLWNPTSEIRKESKKSVSPNWLMPRSSLWSKILFFSINILSTVSFLTYAHSHEVHHVLPCVETHESHKPPGLYIPLIYSWFISCITLSVDTSFHAMVPSGTLASLLTSRAQCQRQQSQQTPPRSERPGGSSRPRFPGANPAGWETAPLPSSQQTLEATTSFPTYEPHFYHYQPDLQYFPFRGLLALDVPGISLKRNIDLTAQVSGGFPWEKLSGSIPGCSSRYTAPQCFLHTPLSYEDALMHYSSHSNKTSVLMSPNNTEVFWWFRVWRLPHNSLCAIEFNANCQRGQKPCERELWIGRKGFLLGNV